MPRREQIADSADVADQLSVGDKGEPYAVRVTLARRLTVRHRRHTDTHLAVVEVRRYVARYPIKAVHASTYVCSNTSRNNLEAGHS